MSRTRFVRAALPAAVAALVTSTASAQTPTDPKPANDLPNPYQTIEGWAKMPEGRTWGSTSAVAVDPDGVSIWVGERCGANDCVGSSLDPVLKFDSTGRLVKSFGAGMILSPHGIFADREGNVWVVDCTCTGRSSPRPDTTRGAPPPASSAVPGKGHQVFKFSSDGRLLLTLGKPSGATDPDYFFQPNAVLVAPSGDVFVSEGHGRGDDRVLKFSKDGKLIKAWGKRGSGPGEFNQPHTLAMDSKGRLFVGDRSNNRIQIFDQDGTYLDAWKQFSRPSGISIDRDDNIYVADSESGSVNKEHGGWKRGMRIGSAKDGSVRAFIPDPAANPPSTSSAEGVAVDARGVIYGAEVGPKDLKRYVRK